MERIPGDVVDLPADRDEDHLPPEPVRDRRAEQERVVTLAQNRWQPPSHRTARLSIRCDRARGRARRRRTAPPRGRAPAGRPDPRARVRALRLRRREDRRGGRRHGARTRGRRPSRRRDAGVALIHHLPCGECDRCRAGHESTCERFAEPTIVPGGFAEQVEAADGVELPDRIGDALGTYLEPLACVLRGASACQRVESSSSARASSGSSSQPCSAPRRRGLRDRRAAGAEGSRTRRARRRSRALRSRGAARRDRAGRHRPRLLPRRPVDLDLVYRNELTLTGSRSATPRHLRRRSTSCWSSTCPSRRYCRWSVRRGDLERYRSGRR